jgi:polyether ionophore transport system permease protein
MFEDNPAIRMMQGVPNALDTAGGFTVWDGGWMMQMMLAVWALLTTSRLLRGEEEAERSELVLAGPVRAGFATGSAVAVVAAALLLIGATGAVTMSAAGSGVTGSVLLGLALAGCGATFAGVAALTSQLVESRRRAAGLAAAALGVAYLVRMFAGSTDERLWMRWTTPLGWLDVMDPYGAADARALIPAYAVPLVLGIVAVALRNRRDVGRSLLRPDAGRAARLRWLGGPTAFAWRGNAGVLFAWLIGLGAVAAVMGALVSTMMDWLAKDQDYQRVMTQYGLDQALTASGFLALLGQMLGLAVALQVAWRVGAVRAEEESGRADSLLSRPLTRLRWAGGHAALALGGAVALAVLSGACVWLGAAASGSGEISLSAAVGSVANVVPVIVLAGGLSVLCFGLAPRLTTAIPVTLVLAGYVVTLLGPALEWPSWVLDLSPFTHLAWVPAAPWAATSGVVMAVLGLLFAVGGLVAFQRRDVVGL